MLCWHNGSGFCDECIYGETNNLILIYTIFWMPNPMVSCYKVKSDKKGSKIAPESKMPAKIKMASKNNKKHKWYMF